MTWTSETVVAKLYEASESIGRVDEQRLKQWAAALRHRPGDEVFDSLIGVFSRPEKTIFVQEYAGRLLLAVQPPCPLDVRDIIGRVLLHWDVSVEQLPWYFESAVGRDALLKALYELSVHPLSQIEQNAIDIFRFWIRIEGR